MSGQDIQLRLVIGADGSAAVSVVKQTAGEVDKLTAAQNKNADATKQQTAAVSALSAQLEMLKGVAAGAFSIGAIVAAWQGYKQTADAVSLLDSRLRLATTSNEDLRRTQQDLLDLSQKLGVSYTTLGGSLARIATTVRDLGGTTQQAVQITEILAATARLSGASTQEQAAAAVQFAQALGSGVLQGDELRSILENNQRLSRALADGLGVTTSELRKLGEEGKLTADVVARAVLSQRAKIESELSQIVDTFAMASQRITNEFDVIIGEINRLGEASPLLQAIAPALDTVYEALKGMRLEAEEAHKSINNGLASKDVADNIGLLSEIFGGVYKAANYLALGVQTISGVIVSLGADIELVGVTAWATLTNSSTKYLDIADALEKRNRTVNESFDKVAQSAANAAKRIEDFDRLQSKSSQQKQALASVSGLDFRAENARLGLNGAASLGGDFGAYQLAARAQKEIEKYGESVMLGSEKAAKHLKEALEKIAPAKAALKATLEKALSTGDDASAAKATAALAKQADDEAKITVDGQRKINEARAAEAKKGRGEANAIASARYAEAIAQEEALQKGIVEALRRGIEQAKLARDAGVLSQTEYWLKVDQLEAEAITRQEASVKRELDKAVAAVAAGNRAKADEVKKYQGELEALDQKRIDIAVKTEGEIAKIQRAAMIAEVAARTKHNEVILGLLENLANLREQQAAELEDKQFELSLLGKSEQQQQRLQALRQIELSERRALTQAYKEYIKAINAADNTEQEVEITNIYNAQQVAIRANAEAQRSVTTAIIDQGAALKGQEAFWGGLFDSIKGGWKGVRDYIKNFFFDWLIQQLKRQFVMNLAVNASGGVGGVGGAVNSASQASSLLSNGMSVVGMLGSIGSGISTIGSALGLTSVAGFGMGLGGTATLAGSTALSYGVAGASTGAAVAGGVAAVEGVVTAVLSAIPVVGWIVLAAAALYGIFGHDGQNGFKIDNNLTNVGNPASHFTPNAIAPFDYSGRGTDSAAIQASLKPLTVAVQTIDAVLATQLLGPETLDKVRANINRINNETSWQNLDKEGIEKGTKEFLMKRYGAIFDEIDGKIAASIRGFTGTSEELLKFIAGNVAVMQLLQVNAVAFKRVIGEAVSIAQLSALQKEGESLNDTLSRVVNTFTATSEIAEIMGKGADAFGAVGLASFAAREQLVALAGGVQQLTAGASYYFEHFFTEEEQLALKRKQAQATLDEAFAAMGLAIPKTRAEYRALIDAQDLSTEAGRRNVVALLRSAEAFDLVTEKVETSARRLDRAGNLIGGPTGESYGLATDGGAMGQGSVAAVAALKPSNDFLNSFLNEAQRQALRLAESTRQVTAAFALADVQLPQTRDDYLRLVYAQDLSTERGRYVYQMLMDNAAAFADLTASGLAATQQIENLVGSNSIGPGDVVAGATSVASAEFLAMMSEAERAAYQFALNTRTVAQAFALVDVAVPQTVAEYIALAQAQDLTTARGRQVYDMLMLNAGAFTALHTAGTVQPTDQYLADFFSETQVAAYKLARAQYEVSTAFDKMGIAAPKTRDEFVALVNSFDQSTEAGRAFVAALMAIAPAFAAATPKPVDAVEATDQYLANFFTETQVAAYKLAQAQKEVNTAFAAAGIAVPATRAEFVALVNSFDQNTEHGRAMVAMLMGIVPAFVAVTTAVQTAITTISYQVGDLMNIGSGIANDAWAPITQIIEGGTQSLAVKLAAKLQQADALAKYYDDMSKTFAEGDDAHRLAFEAARDQMLQIRAGLAGNIALLATVTAQYGSALAEQMYDLEIWHAEQIAAANGNAALLLLIEQSYADKRNAILTGGVANGLNSLKATIQAWINNLLLNSALTTLTPQQQLDEARRQYDAALLTGDGAQITRAADAYLQQARNFYASGAQYSAIFAAVLAQMQLLANGQGAPIVPPTPTPMPRGTAGNFTGLAGGAVAQSRAAADSAAKSASDATNVLANVMAAVKYTIDDQGRADRADRAESTKKIVAALSPIGGARVEV